MPPGNLQEAELNQSQVEKIGNVDILMFPVGNGQDLGAKEALKVVSQIEPSIAVPMNYQIPKLELTPTTERILEGRGAGKR